MNMYEVIEKLKAGEFTVDLGGHRVNGRDTVIQDVIARLEDDIRLAEEWRDNPPEDDENKDWGQKFLDRYARPNCVEFGKPFPNRLSREYFCFNCGKNLSIMPCEGNVLRLWEYASPGSLKDFTKVISECEFKDGVHPYITRIDVPTGQLLFANFFRHIESAPEGKRYSGEFNLDSLKGRRNSADHIASQNAGYQQTGNMTVHLYKHKGRDEIAVSRRPVSFLEEDLEYCRETTDPESLAKVEELERAVAFFGDYDYLGEICCDMWRWMCIDTHHLPAGFVRENQDYVEVAVTPGTWAITDFYGCNGAKYPMALLRRE